MSDELTLEVSANTSRAVGELDAFIASMGKMRGAGVALDDVLDKMDASLTKVSRGLRDANSAVKGTDNSLKSAHTAWDKQNKLYDEYLTHQESATRATNNSAASLSSQRYALYDVATTYGAISAALLATSVIAVKTAADFESSFTNVERTFDSSTTGDQISAIRGELVDLSTQIPRTFEEISKVAQLGNQLGISADNLTGFTETVIKASTAFGVSIEETALAFGRIGDLLDVAPEQYNALGSSIALVGVSSQATEAQILSLTKELSATAAGAGFTAAEVVGLSGALASLGVAPERARGSLDTYFATLNRAVSNGGADLENFAQIVGVTAQELESLVRSGQGEKIFKGFLEGLADLDNVDTTRALDALDLAQLRVSNTFQRLSSNMDTYNSSQADAARGWAEQTELSRQFAFIVDDLSSQFMMLVNSVNALIDELTGGLVPGIAGVVGGLTELVNWLREIAENPVAQQISSVVFALTLMVGVLAAFRATSYLASASAIGFIQAQRALATAAGGSAGGIRTLIGLLTGYTKVAADGTIATTGLRGAIIALGRATIILGIISLAVEFLFNFNETMANTLDLALSVSGVFQSVHQAFADTANAAANAVSAVAPLAWVLQQVANAHGFLAGSIKKGVPVIKQWSADLRKAGESSSETGDYLDEMSNYLPGVDNLSKGIGNLGNSAKGAAAKVVTLKDYASDLAGVMARSFEIRFGAQSAFDDITSKWIDLNDQMREYQQKVAQLTADKKVKEYFLSIAEAYDDTLRAGVLRAELMKIDEDLADAQSVVSKELTGNSKAAIANRKNVSELVTGYQNYITALAASGADQNTLNQAVARSQSEFMAQATALGYAESELQTYVVSFRDMAVAINNVPRNITVSANTDPAIQALNEFMAAARTAASGGITIPVNAVGTVSAGARDAMFTQWATLAQAQYGRALAQSASGWAEVRRLWASGAYGNAGFKSGGYTGNGGVGSEAGVVHGKEFVFNAQATKNAGVGNLYGMMRSFEQGRGYQSGGYVGPRVSAPSGNGSGVQVVALDMAQFSALLKAGNVSVNIGAEQLTNVVDDTNQKFATLGRG